MKGQPLYFFFPFNGFTLATLNVLIVVFCELVTIQEAIFSVVRTILSPMSHSSSFNICPFQFSPSVCNLGKDTLKSWQNAAHRFGPCLHL